MDDKLLQARLREFARERDWDQFHSPKNLTTALMCEAGELAEVFQWLTPEQSHSVMSDPALARAVREEMADVLLYLLRLADKLNVNLEEAALAKMHVNAAKYPVDVARGSAEKYSRRGE